MESKRERVQKISVTDEIVSRIRAMILSGEVGVGKKLPTEMELRERFGVGRSSVREAIRTLQAIGLVEIRPGTGAFVAAQDQSQRTIHEWFVEKETELDELMEVRLAIEPAAVRLAAQRATTAEVAEIDNIHRQFLAAVAENDAVRLAALDEAYHRSIMRASHNKMLAKMSDLVADALRDYRARSFTVSELLKNAVGPHSDILKALQNGDSELGSAAMETHLDISLEDIRKVAHEE